jgi:thiol-disulfide isomerase/thioredoxin
MRGPGPALPGFPVGGVRAELILKVSGRIVTSTEAGPDHPQLRLPLNVGQMLGRRAWLLLAAAAAVGLLAVGVVRLTSSKAAGLPVVGQVIPAAQRPRGPDISGTTLTGQHLHIAGWRGGTVVINFWGSWCVPCRREAPALRRVADDTRFLGVHFAGIDIREEPAAGLAFERRYRISYPSISDPGNLIAVRFGVIAPVATPSTYIFDARGRVAWAYFGATTYSQLELAVTEVARP